MHNYLVHEKIIAGKENKRTSETTPIKPEVKGRTKGGSEEPIAEKPASTRLRLSYGRQVRCEDGVT